jgi:hypothetical protein
MSHTGTLIGSEVQVNWDGFTKSSLRCVATTDGGFVIAYEVTNKDTADAKQGIYFQRFTSSGSAVLTETLINAVTANDQKELSLDAFPNNAVMFIFNDYQTGATIVRRFDTNNSPSAEITIVALTLSIPNMCAWADGSWAAVYKNTPNIEAVKYDNTNTKIISATVLNSISTGTRDYPAVGCLSDGSHVAGW